MFDCSISRWTVKMTFWVCARSFHDMHAFWRCLNHSHIFYSLVVQLTILLAIYMMSDVRKTINNGNAKRVTHVYHRYTTYESTPKKRLSRRPNKAKKAFWQNDKFFAKQTNRERNKNADKVTAKLNQKVGKWCIQLLKLMSCSHDSPKR